MVSAPSTPRSAPAKVGGMRGYLASLPERRDVLRFDTPSQATDAARALRERHPDVRVNASYDRVTLELA